MKFDSILMTTLLSAPYLMILLQRNFQFDEIPADLILQILNGVLLTRLYSLFQQSNSPLYPEQDKALTPENKNSMCHDTTLLGTILRLFKEDPHRK